MSCSSEGSAASAVTDEDGSWDLLGIKPVRFNRVDGPSAYRELYDGVQMLAERATRGALDWQTRMAEIGGREPPADAEATGEVEYALREVHTTRFFTNVARSAEWPKWLGARKHLDALFSPAELNERDKLLAWWLAEHFAIEHPNVIFDLLATHGMRLNPNFWWSIGRELGVVKDKPLEEPALKRWVSSHGVLHADETPVAMLAPGKKKTHKAYLWAYCPGVFEGLKAVVYDFADSRAGEHARAFLQRGNEPWKGKLVCDDYAGYKASFTQGITEVGCAAHARRKFFELYTSNKSAVAEQALKFFGELYEIEREVRDLGAQQRLEIRRQKARPVADALHAWMIAHRLRATDGTALARALDYSLKRWTALIRYIDDGQL